MLWVLERLLVYNIVDIYKTLLSMMCYEIQRDDVEIKHYVKNIQQFLLQYPLDTEPQASNFPISCSHPIKHRPTPMIAIAICKFVSENCPQGHF